LRGGLFDLSVVPNSKDLDPQFSQFQWVGEIEHRHQLWGLPGKVAINGFLSRGRMGRFDDAIQLAQATGAPADITAVRQYRSRGGLSVLASNFRLISGCSRAPPFCPSQPLLMTACSMSSYCTTKRAVP
jgi:hypothetical protein